MMKMNRFVSGAMACLVAFAVSGYAKPANVSAVSSNFVKKENVTLTYLASQGHVEQAEETLGAMFEKKTGIKIDYQIVPAAQYTNILNTKLSSGECTDIFSAQNGKFDIVSNLNVVKNCVDLSKQRWVSRMDKKVAEQLSVNGKLYGLMIWDTYSEWPIMYNKKIFSKLKLSVPTTYPQFKKACQKIKAAGITPLWKAGADGWQLPLAFLDDGPDYEAKTKNLSSNLNKNKTTFAANKAMLQVLQEEKEMYSLGFFGSDMLSQTGSKTTAAMGSGKYAMTLTVLSEAATVAKGNKGVSASDFGFFENPLCGGQILCSSSSGPSKFIYKKSSHVKEAEEYFDYITLQNNLEYQLKHDDTKVGLCFSRISNKLTSEMKSYIKRYKKTGTFMQYEVKYLNPQWSSIDKDLQAMFVGSETPKNVLANIDLRRKQAAQAAKDSAWKK